MHCRLRLPLACQADADAGAAAVKSFPLRGTASCSSRLRPARFCIRYKYPMPCCVHLCPRAKNITNKPRINEDPKDAMLREFQDEIMRLKAALAVRCACFVGVHSLMRRLKGAVTALPLPVIFAGAASSQEG